MRKIAFIGAGSFGFTRGLVRDILTFPALADSTIALMDIDPERLAFVKTAVEKMSVPYLEEFEIIDRYAGEPVPKDKASLSLRFVYRNAKATLTAEDVDKAEHKLLMALKAALKIQLREGGPA